MRMFRSFLALCCSLLATCSSGSVLEAKGSSIGGKLSGLSLPSSLDMFSKELKQDIVDKEIRKMIINWAAEANRTKGKESFTVEADDLITGKGLSFLNHGRQLATDSSYADAENWALFNEILGSFELTIPDITPIEQELLGFILTIQLNGTCSKFSLDEVLLDWDKGSGNETLAYKVQVIGAQFKCFLEVHWNTGVLDVSDDLKLKLVANDINFGLALDLKGAPPKNSSILGCKVTFSIGDIASTGGFSSNIINELNYLVVDIVRNEAALISRLACDVISGFTDTIDETLASVGKLLDPYLNQTLTDVDPLYLEKELGDTDVELVNFQEGEGFGNVVNVLVTNIGGVFSADQINTLVELNLLNDNGTFVLELGEVPVEDGSLRFLQGEEEQTEAPASNRTCSLLGGLGLRRRLTGMFQNFVDERRRLQLDGIALDEIVDTENLLVVNEITPIKVTVVGLNNFSDAQPIEVIGKYSFLTQLALDNLYVEAEIYIDVAINNVTVQELITVGVDLKDIFVNTSYLIGLAAEEVNQWTIGTFLDTDNLIPCLLSAVEVAGVQQLDVTVGFIGTPFVSGLISRAVNDLANTALDGAVCVYQDLIKEIIPGFFQNNVTKLVNDYVDCYIEVEGSKGVCDYSSLSDALGEGTLAPTSDVEFDFKKAVGARKIAKKTAGDGFVPGFLDFRDLLLTPDKAKALGGTGREPYGDLISMAFAVFQDQLTSVDNATGLIGVNSFLPSEPTDFEMVLFNTVMDTNSSILSALLERIAIAAYNIRVQNANTLISPVKFLEPTTKAHVLENLFNVGPVPDRSLNAMTTLFMELDGSDSPVAMRNEVNAVATFPNIDVFADIQIMISTMDFINFPLRDILNLQCWFALMQEPNTMSEEKMVDKSFEIKSMLVDIMEMSVMFECLNCTSKTLPGAVECLEDAGAMKVLGDRMGPIFEEITKSEMFPPLVTDLVGIGDAAARQCPHSPLYNTTANETTSLDIEIPLFSNKSVDTIVYAGVLAAEVFGVVFAESHLINNVNQSDPRSGQKSFNFNMTNDIDLLDWYKLNETFIPFAGDLLDFVKEYLAGTSEEGVLGVNGLAEGFLNEDGVFDLSVGMAINLIDGYDISIDALQVYGLDSFKMFDILEPIAPQTLENRIEMGNLTVMVDFSVNVTNTSDPAQSYRVSFEIEDVNATVYLFTAIDMAKVESLTLGSLLFIENILPCLLASSLDIHVPAMRVTIGNLSEPVVEGLMPDTSAAAAASIEAIFKKYGSMMVNATNSIFDNSIREILNEFVTSYIEGSPECQTPDAFVNDIANSTYIDFRDLLLPPESAVLLGGTGEQPYGDVASTAYAIILDMLKTDNQGDLLELNSNIESFTESQSGVKGMFRLEEELFGFDWNESLPVDYLASLKERIEMSAFDSRIRNLNTLVSPAAIAHPTANPYMIENVLNFGPIAKKPIAATLGVLLGIEGDLTSLDMFNMFDISGNLTEVNMVAMISVFILKENLFRFPLRDVLQLNCWLSLVETPNAATNTSSFKIESLFTKLSSLSVDVDCYNCTSRVLSEAIRLADEAGASGTLGDRLGFLIEDIATSDVVPNALKSFIDLGDDAARLCPHHPLFNTSSNKLDASNDTMALPVLSSLSLDTILYAAAVLAEVAVVVGADNHLQNPGEPTDPLAGQNALIVPEGAKLIDWTNMNEVGIPYMAELLDFVRNFLGGSSETETGGQDLGVNSLVAGFVDENGTFVAPLDFSFESNGAVLQVNSIRAKGLDSFSVFDILDPIAPQTFQNNISLDKLTVQLDISVDFPETAEPPNHLNVTFDMDYINATVPLFAAVDEDLLGNLPIGNLLHLSNILPCLLSTTYGFRLEQINVTVENISEPIFEGLLPDTSEALANSTSAIFGEFGDMVKESIPYVFQDTIRVIINAFLSSYGESACIDYPKNTTSRYIDFRELFRPSNSSGYSPYGDVIPLAKEMLQEELFANNPETNLPKINDVLIAPFTEGQSGIEGTLVLPGKLFGFESEALGGYGAGIVGVEFFDARVENLDTFGEPLEVLEPNHTRGDLVDNRATFGTQLNPLRFAIRGSLYSVGPFVESRDEMDIFGELRSTPAFAVLLARLGAQEILNLPLRYTSNVDCWLGALAEPALDAIEAGNLTVNPVLSMHYLEIAFESMRMSASCLNCTTKGLLVVPDLLEILETTTAKNVLGYRNIELMLDIINSDFAQVWLLRIFQESLTKCEYTENATSIETEYENPEFPQLSEYAMETGVFTVTVMIQLGLVIMAETISEFEGGEPLISGPEPNIPPGTRLVDFTAMNEYPNGALIKTMIDTLNDFLGSPQENPLTGEKSLGINTILGNPFSPINEFYFDNEFDIGLSGLRINIKGITVSGLDTFTRFSMANITGPTTLRHELGWERLQLEIGLEISLEGFREFGGEVDSDLLRLLQEQNIEGDGKYPFALTIEMVDVVFDAETFMALDYDLLKYIELGDFLRFAYVLPCIQASVLHLEFTDVVFEIGRISKMQVSGFQSEDTIVAAENLEEVLVEKYGETIASMAPTVFSVAMLPILNNVINNYLRDSDFKCDEFPFDPSTEGFVDFRDLFLPPATAVEYGGSGRAQYGDLISSVFQFSNLFIQFFLLDFIAKLDFPGTLYQTGIKFDVRRLKAILVLKISDLSIENADSVTTLTYTNPIMGEPFMLNNTAKFGVGRKTVLVKFRMLIAFMGLAGDLKPVDIYDDFEVTIDIKRLSFVITALLKVREEDFVKFPLRDMTRLNCWLATIPPPELDAEGYRLPGQEPTFSIEDLLVSLDELKMSINCLNCTSPGLEEMNDLLLAPGSSDDLTLVANQILQAVADSFGGAVLQDLLDSLLVNAPKLCPHKDNYDPNAPAFQFRGKIPETDPATYIYYVLAIIIPLVLIVITVLCVRMVVLKRHKKWLASLPSEKVFLVQQIQEKEDHLETELNELTLSMYESEEVPRTARILVPIIVVINVGFFLSGHLNLAARAILDVQLVGEHFRLNNFFDFSIAQSTLDMWTSGGKQVSILILLFSGIWPYTKQLITLALWFLPPSVVTVSRRGQFLLWLDILAKWSMIDIFVLLITVAGFRIGGSNPDLSFLPRGFYDIQILVIPMWGLYSNMFAQIMSQVSSHFIVMYHRRIIRAGTAKYMDRHHPQSKSNLVVEQVETTDLLSPTVPEDEKKDQMCTYAFTRPHKEEGDKLVAGRTVNFLLAFISAILCVLLVFCCILPSMIVETRGIVALAIELGNRFSKQAEAYCSIFSMSVNLIDQAKYLNTWYHYIGLGIMAFLFIATTLVVPCVLLATVVYMWFFPQTRMRRERVAIVIETLQAWQYVEVYILGIVIMSWQLGSTSKLLLNRYCDDISGALGFLGAYGILNPEDAQCLELEASITTGAYLLLPFVFGLAAVLTYVVKAYVQYLREKHEEDDGISEEEKLRAFDRTTWDNRESAIENIRQPAVVFTDTFRWTLRKKTGTGEAPSHAAPPVGEEPKLDNVITYPVPDTSSSGSENTGEKLLQHEE